jgi:dCTP deaminase
MFSNAAFVEEHRERLNALWKDPDFREMMADQCRELNIRKEIDEVAVKNALEEAGSIRGAARLLNCDKTVFRRFKDIVIDFKENLIAKRITAEQFMAALRKHGSGVQACKALGVGRSFGKRHFSNVLSEYYGSKIASNHKVVSVVDHGEVEDVYCLTAPEYGNFALDAGVFVNNCGLFINTTPIEAGWEGNVVLELANMCSLPIKVYTQQGIAQFLFFKGEMCDTSYSDRGGKYQGQVGITLPKV